MWPQVQCRSQPSSRCESTLWAFQHIEIFKTIDLSKPPKRIYMSSMNLLLLLLLLPLSSFKWGHFQYSSKVLLTTFGCSHRCATIAAHHGADGRCTGADRGCFGIRVDGGWRGFLEKMMNMIRDQTELWQNLFFAYNSEFMFQLLVQDGTADRPSKEKVSFHRIPLLGGWRGGFREMTWMNETQRRMFSSIIFIWVRAEQRLGDDDYRS